jgi:hypothetical protein
MANLDYRYASVTGTSASTLEAYLPGNYALLYTDQIPGTSIEVHVIGGRDNAGWTLEDYVIPRLASGLITCKELETSHPLVERIEYAEAL